MVDVIKSSRRSDAVLAAASVLIGGFVAWATAGGLSCGACLVGRAAIISTLVWVVLRVATNRLGSSTGDR